MKLNQDLKQRQFGISKNRGSR